MSFSGALTLEKPQAEYRPTPSMDRTGPSHDNDNTDYARCVENFTGTLRVPVGMAGPLQVKGKSATGMFSIPMATTEGALVASYHRGCIALNRSGGVQAAVVAEAMIRAPGFRFTGLFEAMAFTQWLDENAFIIRRVAESTSRHCRLVAAQPVIEGNQVFLQLKFKTGEAAGQNMVTLATDAVCQFIRSKSPVSPEAVWLEANFSGDKKASSMSLPGVRGKRTVAEATISSRILTEVLGVTPAMLEDYGRAGAIGAAMSGTLGQHGHYANALAAIYLALGQDCACVAESAVGITRMEVRNGDLYACVTLPNLIFGSVGGGTGLPDQSQFIQALGLPATDTAKALAEITAGICLAGELSITASLSAGTFARAHRVLGRRRNHRGND